jgi:hypothetical protein
MQTISTLAIADKMAELLAANTALNAWCVGKYDNEPLIFVGIDLRNQPSEDTMPHILILPAPKDEGLGVSENTYRIHVLWCIKDTTLTTEGNITRLQGLYDSDTFGQMIWTILAGFSANCPVSRVEYDIDGTAIASQFPGFMTLEIHVPVVFGAAITL